jgi:hypothetical protein
LAAEHPSLALSQRVLEELLSTSLAKHLLHPAAVAHNVGIATCTIGSILHRHGLHTRRSLQPRTPTIVPKPHKVRSIHLVFHLGNAEASVIIEHEIVSARAVRMVMLILGVESALRQNMRRRYHWDKGHTFILFL